MGFFNFIDSANSLMLERFIDFLTSEKRYSEHTIRAYRSDLDQFFSFLDFDDEMDSYSNIKASDIKEWIVEMVNLGISSRTVNRKISSVKSFFRFLMRGGTLNNDPTEQIVSPKMTKNLPDFVSEKDMEILENSNLFGNDFEGIRDKLIIEIFYQTGMRVSEVVALKRNQFVGSPNSIKILGKRNKERLIPINVSLLNLINDYLKEREKLGSQAEELFITTNGKPMYSRLMYSVVNNFLTKVTTVSKRSPHTLRHTFATHMLNRGADLNTIKELLGHSSLAATEVYTHNSFEQLKLIHKQAHPRA
ncbi:MAG TPA: integrase [Flavobacteriales bacterium]|nr:integrase [Flavobacteriales bacterium]